MDNTLKIKEIKENKKSYTLTLEEENVFDLPKKYKYIPKINDVLTIFTTNGTLLRGINVNGEKLYYKSDKQLGREHKQLVNQISKKQKEQFQKQKKTLDEQYCSLPIFFKKRIDKFRENNPDFRIKYESYEMFCCFEAFKIAIKCKTKDGVQAFTEMDFKEQVKYLPELSENHSNNTFNFSCRLAYLYLSENPQKIVNMYGALSPLIGSKEYTNGNKS